jgi:pyridoxal/pyridoxine/pyridoxamine kinase
MTEDALAEFLNKLNDLSSDYGLVVGGYQQEEEQLQLLMVKSIQVKGGEE